MVFPSVEADGPPQKLNGAGLPSATGELPRTWVANPITDTDPGKMLHLSQQAELPGREWTRESFSDGGGAYRSGCTSASRGPEVLTIRRGNQAATVRLVPASWISTR